MYPDFFPTLRAANLARLPTHKNAKGKPSHTHKTGKDWSLAQWLQATIGELGEYCNFRKKYERGDITKTEFTAAAQAELADTLTYLDILAAQHEIEFSIAELSSRWMPMLPVNLTPAELVAEIQIHFGQYWVCVRAYRETGLSERNFYPRARNHLGMVVACLYQLSTDLKINLADATFDKFNHVSERIGSPIMIGKDGVIDLRESSE